MGDGRAKRKKNKTLRVRHEHFRNRVFKLLAGVGPMTHTEIWYAFFDGHPLARQRTGEKWSQRTLPHKGTIPVILRRDGRFAEDRDTQTWWVKEELL